MRLNIIIYQVIFLTVLFMSSKAEGVLNSSFVKDWRFENVESVEFANNRMTIYGLWDPRIFIPIRFSKTEDYYILNIKVKSTNPTGLIRISWMTDGVTKSYPLTEIPLKPDLKFHTYSLDLRNRVNPFDMKMWNGAISNITIAFFGFADTIEFEDIFLSAPDDFWGRVQTVWNNFLLPNPITPSSINMALTPYLFTLPYIFIINSIIISVSAVILGYYFFMRPKEDTAKKIFKKKARTTLFMAILACWFLYDIRDVYNQIFLVRSINETFVKPDTKKYFPIFDDFYSFADFIVSNLPKDIENFYFHEPPGQSFSITMKYLSYPISLLSPGSKTETNNYHVIYKNPAVRVINGILHINGKPFIEGVVIKRYDDFSFIFKEGS